MKVTILECLLLICSLCVRIDVTAGLVIKTVCVDLSESSGSFECDESGKSDESTQCKIRKHLINPDDLVTTEDDEWEFDKNFLQRIEVELCENAGSPCSHHSTKTTTVCRQRFISIQLQVMSRNTSLSEMKAFRIPSNCECAVVHP